MRETVTSFINRVAGDNDWIRVEASDMLPIQGYKAYVIKEINSKPDCLFLVDFKVEKDGSVTITASFQSV